jgi:hypothetical protein
MGRVIVGVALCVAVISGCARAANPAVDTVMVPIDDSTTTTALVPSVETSTSSSQPPVTTTTTTTTTTSTTTTTAPSREVVTLEVRSRESWGAKAPDGDLESHGIEVITIHHTARQQDDTPMEERLQRWQNYHQSIGFGDIAYHMVIAADGTVFQGREYQYVGSTRTSYDPMMHFLPTIDGMFDEFWDSPNDDDEDPDGADNLSTEQLQSLIDLLAWASSEFGVDPTEIGGHRDHAATACPGSVVYEMIHSGEIAELVQQRIDSVDLELVYVS